MLSHPEKSALVELLAWYREMGVDSALTADPVDWIAKGETAPGAVVREAISSSRIPSSTPAPSLPPPANSPQRAAPRLPPGLRGTPPPSPTATQSDATARRFPTAPPDAALKSARQLAGDAQDLDALLNALKGFDGCGLKATAKNTCFYRGAQQARTMIIGEAPGRDEDLQGKPFVGRAGLLLDKMLEAIELSENDVHITNIVYWRPPGNRTPTPQEALVCRPFLERQIELVNPEIIVLLGGAAAKQILNTTEGIMRQRGKWKTTTIGSRELKTIATLHPAYLLRTPAAKRKVWQDLLKIKAALS